MSENSKSDLEYYKIAEEIINSVIPARPEEPLEGSVFDPNTPLGKFIQEVRDNLLKNLNEIKHLQQTQKGLGEFS